MKYESTTRKIIAAAMTVHSKLESGYPEIIYQNAFEIELGIMGISFVREFEMSIYYRDILIGIRRADFFIEDAIITELKAISELEGIHFNQALNYLEMSNSEIGLLINFGAESLQFHRLTNKKYKPLSNPINPTNIIIPKIQNPSPKIP